MKSNERFFKVIAFTLIWTVGFLSLAGFSSNKAIEQDPQILAKMEEIIEKNLGEKVNIRLGKSGRDTNETWSFTAPKEGIFLKAIASDVTISPSDTNEVVILANGRLHKDLPSLLEITESGGSLNISQPDDNSGMTIEIKIPKGYSKNLSIALVSGDIELKGVSLHLFEAKSTSGDIMAEELKAADLKVKTISGDVRIQNNLEGNYEISTTSGDVQLELKQGFEADFRLYTLSGDIQNNFPAKKNAKHSVSVSTTSGDINIE
jgi:hypothetical protein